MDDLAALRVPRHDDFGVWAGGHGLVDEACPVISRN